MAGVDFICLGSISDVLGSTDAGWMVGAGREEQGKLGAQLLPDLEIPKEDPHPLWGISFSPVHPSSRLYSVMPPGDMATSKFVSLSPRFPSKVLWFPR